jgi:serine phosphatase RsbU (regulator of sigma subunit)
LYIFGMLSLAVSMSMYLAYDFGWINKDLALQLENVKKLSAAALEQERIAARLEAERRIVAADNERKTRELESARQLQLSLLPTVIPKREDLEIACFMKTATEVGGDYYDIFEDARGGLTAVVGDATGHGLKAGNMVIVTKGLLNVLGGGEDLAEIMRTANTAIKRMRLHMLTMCLAIARFEGRKLTYCSAGMPPLLVFRAQTGSVEQHVLKAMPLGAAADFPYKSLTTELSSGDAAVMISDGLMETFNPGREEFGMESVIRSVQSHGKGSAQQIVDALVADATAWSNGTPLADDMTVVVVKMVA